MTAEAVMIISQWAKIKIIALIEQLPIARRLDLYPKNLAPQN